MMWYADKAAFRAGNVNSLEWAKHNIGKYSFASGHNTLAIEISSSALGFYAHSLGNYSTAMGFSSTTWGESSTALGYYSLCNGHFSTAMGFSALTIGDKSTSTGDYAATSGYNTTASGDYSIAMGNTTYAIGLNSTAMGYTTYATGSRSTAMGDRTTASGENSTAMGTAIHTNNKGGSFAIGDASPSTTTQGKDANNQMMMRFAGGYKLYTNSTITVGVSLAAGGNSWATISDRNKKENFAAVDGEVFLKKIAKFNLTSWNYKGQDPATHRHYGPMAQDFYAAFGKDQYGTIGNDTTISQADMEGVSFVAIQALVKRTEELQKENEMMKHKIDMLEHKNTCLGNENSELKAEITNRIEALERKILITQTVAK